MRWLDGITDSMDMSLSKLEDGEGQGSLACCSPRVCKELDTTERRQQEAQGYRGFERGTERFRETAESIESARSGLGVSEECQFFPGVRPAKMLSQ